MAAAERAPPNSIIFRLSADNPSPESMARRTSSHSEIGPALAEAASSSVAVTAE